MSHADLETLLAYWLGELDEALEGEVEAHYLGCDACSARLAELEALAAGVRGAFASGRIGTVLTPAFVERLRERGLRLREYRVPRNGSVNCSVAPEDEVLLSRLQVPLAGVTRIDVITADHRLEDVPFDAVGGEVLVAPAIAHIRTLPAHRQVIRVVSVAAGAETLLGEYTFNHTPHDAAGASQ